VPKFGLLFCQDVSTFCGGAIGAGSAYIIQRFCSKSPRECNIVKHLSSSRSTRRWFFKLVVAVTIF
jgi:hypothetical protein